MAQIVTQNPGSSEVQSALIAGITEGLNKISATLNLKTSTLSDVQLTPVSIDNQEKNKNRIYEAPTGNKLWLSEPAPVIKKNGSVITQSGSNFTIDLIGGSVTFSQDDRPSDSDAITVTATYIIAESTQIEQISNTLSVVQTQSNKYKGNYDNPEALQLAVPSGQNGDFAIVFNPLAVYAWKNDGWYDTRSVEDLSNYYQKEETNNLLDQKEPKIPQKGSSSSDDNYYWGGRKTWQDLFSKVRSVTLTGLSTASDAVVSATDTILSAIGKLQSQITNSVQKAYLSGTGAPTKSTPGKVGQRYINTSNGDEYTCEAIDGSSYVWRMHPRSVLGKTPQSTGGNIDISANDIPNFPGAGSHNSIYRGNNLGSAVTEEQWASIADGTFDDMYIGDYWVIGGVTYRIAAFDYYCKTGDNVELTTHHVTLVPDTPLYNHVMNDAISTTGGYVGSKMYKTGLNEAKSTINSAFGSSHVLNHRKMLCNAVTNGNPSGGSWYDSTVELMTERVLYGNAIFGVTNGGSSVHYMHTTEKSQFPLFSFRHDLISNRYTFWLRDVAASVGFSYVTLEGAAGYRNANANDGVRPAFSICQD